MSFFLLLCWVLLLLILFDGIYGILLYLLLEFTKLRRCLFVLFCFAFHRETHVILASWMLKWHIVSLQVAVPAIWNSNSPLAPKRLCEVGRGRRGRRETEGQGGFYAFALGKFVFVNTNNQIGRMMLCIVFVGCFLFHW